MISTFFPRLQITGNLNLNNKNTTESGLKLSKKQICAGENDKN